MTLAKTVYFESKKSELEKKREESKNQSYGRPKVGGPWSLVDHHGTPVTDLDFAGKFMLLYFGYTFCPDVCPEELDKMALIIDAIGGGIYRMRVCQDLTRVSAQQQTRPFLAKSPWCPSSSAAIPNETLSSPLPSMSKVFVFVSF